MRLLPLLFLTVGVLAAATTPAFAQSQVCPLIGDGDVSTAVGSRVQASPFMVVDAGSSIQCLFEGDAVGDGVLVGRYPNFFGSQDVQPFSAGQDRLHFLLADGLPADSPINLATVDGVGDTAAWVTPVDSSTAPDSLGRLLIRRGADAFVVGITMAPTAVATATSVGQSLLAQ